MAPYIAGAQMVPFPHTGGTLKKLLLHACAKQCEHELKPGQGHPKIVR
jgi:hypothetical protein